MRKYWQSCCTFLKKHLEINPDEFIICKSSVLYIWICAHINTRIHSHSYSHSHSHSHWIYTHTLMKVLNKYQRKYSTEIVSFIVCCCYLHINQIESVCFLLLLFMSLLFLLFYFVIVVVAVFLQNSTIHIISIILVFTDFLHTHCLLCVWI